MERLLIIGGSGFLGRRLTCDLATRFAIVATCHTTCRSSDFPLDLAVTDAVKHAIVKIAPDIIVHCGGLTDVDSCEMNPVRAWAVNVEGTRAVLEATSAKVIYVSTDYVFDGDAGPYVPGTPPTPVNVYGATKAAAEHDVLSASRRNAVVRVAGLYGLAPGHLRVPDLVASESISARVDQYSTPLYVNDVARNFTAIVGQGGITHLVGEARLSRYDLFRAIVGAAGSSTRVRGIRSAEDRRPARRPADASLVRSPGLVTTPFESALRCFGALADTGCGRPV